VSYLRSGTSPIDTLNQTSNHNIHVLTTRLLPALVPLPVVVLLPVVPLLPVMLLLPVLLLPTVLMLLLTYRYDME
jgi:hypothetical protein